MNLGHHQDIDRKIIVLIALVSPLLVVIGALMIVVTIFALICREVERAYRFVSSKLRKK